MATHSNILAWRIPWTEEPGGLQVHGIAELDTAEQLTLSLHICVCVCVTTNILGQKYWLLIPSSSRRNQDSLERWLILGQGKYKMSLDHVAVLEVKKVPLHTYTHTNSCNDGTMPRGTGASERPPNGQCWNINIMQ